MLDRLKDIVPEVNENKANLIYQKSIKPKFHFNFQLVLKFAILLIVFIPIFVIMGLNNSGDVGNDSASPDQMEPEEALPNSPGLDAPNDESSNGVEEDLEYYIAEFNNGVLELYFPSQRDTYYLKEYEGYEILSVIVDGNEIAPNDGIYCLNSPYVSVVLNSDNIEDKVLLLISNDNKSFDLKQIKIK